MTVRELIEQLRKLNPELPVYVASDAEGNSFAPLAHVGEGRPDDFDDADFGEAEFDGGFDDFDRDAPESAALLWPE